MPPNIWFPLLIILFFLGAFTSNGWLVTISVAIAVFLGIALLWSKHSLDNVYYRRRIHYRRGFPGEHTGLRIEVENRKRLPISWLRISDMWPLAAGPSDEKILKASHLPAFGRLINIFSLRSHEKITRNYDLEFRERGVYPIGPTEMASGDLFGLYEQRQTDEKTEHLIVFPELLSMKALEIETENPMGDHRSHRQIFEDPNRPLGVRNYHPEDEFRRIHWPATARTGELQVKVYQPVNSKVMVVCLNIATSAQPWLGNNHQLSEHLIKLAGTICYQNVQQGYSVGLISNSCLAHSDQPFIIQPSHAQKQLPYLLESLARITLLVTSPFETFLTRALPRLPFGASLVIITAVVTPSLCETLMRLKRYRSNTTLITLDTAPPPRLPGIQIIHMPYQVTQPESEK
ncbi:MAG: DUF58 domain-containing protein [Chloroflexi bacterium]|nr:DUF58 domain-containing protein [Chloroflexota bacterium]